MSNLQVHSERSARTGICIVWPAWFSGSTDPELHVTALFLGNIDTVDYTKADVERVLGSYPWPAWTKVKGTEMFGRNKDVPVLTLEHDYLLVMTREVIERRLEANGIQASTEFGFNPHVTMAKELVRVLKAQYQPRDIHLEAPVLWWGPERVLHSAHQ